MEVFSSQESESCSKEFGELQRTTMLPIMTPAFPRHTLWSLLLVVCGGFQTGAVLPALPSNPHGHSLNCLTVCDAKIRDMIWASMHFLFNNRQQDILLFQLNKTKYQLP